jgi:hypothetical protein
MGKYRSGASKNDHRARLRRHTPLIVVLALAALALTAAPAFATGEHAVGTPFGTPGSGPGQFSEPAGVAVNEETGEVYVVDKGNNRVEWFNSTGTKFEGEFNGSGSNPVVEGPGSPIGTYPGGFSAPESIAIDNDPSSPSHGDVYVEDPGQNAIDKFSSTGEYKGQLTGVNFEELHGVAVDSNGNVWVYRGSREEQNIYSFSDEEPNVLTGSHESQAKDRLVSGIAVDSEDNLYVVHESERYVAKLTGEGDVIGGSTGEEFGHVDGVTGLAVEPSSNDVYIDNGATVGRFGGAGGAPLERLGSGLLKSGAGVAVSSSSGSVYVADATANVVDVFPARKEAGISDEQATNVREMAATLQAEIDPNEYATTYHFEYDTSPYASSAPHGTSVPAPNAEAGSGSSPVPVSVEVPSLEPDMTYHYRVVTDSDVNGTPTPAYGPDESFTTPAPASSAPETCPNAKLRSEQPYGSTLPDCRAYELVSPLNKNDNDVSFVNARASTSDGSPALAYLSPGSFSGPKAAPTNGRYVSTRGSDGWSTQNVSPPYGIVEGGLISPFSELLLTPELSKGLVLSTLFPLVGGEPGGLTNLYVANFEDGSYQTVTNVKSPGAVPYEPGTQTGPLEPKAMGASTDLSHVVFQQDASLTAGASPNEDHVYEWVNGKLSLVDVPPTGTTFAGEDEVGAPFNVEEVDDAASSWHAVSASGSRVFFTGAEGREEHDLGQLYVRENPEQPPVDESRCTVSGDACTIQVSASQRTNPVSGDPEPDPNGPQPAYFRDASADGEQVFFTSRAELTNDANTGPADNAANLYEYDLASGKLTDLTVVTTAEEAEDPDGAAVLNLVTAGEAGFTAGEQGSYVYFVANGVLASNENADKETAKPGNCKQENAEELSGERTCSLYVEHYNGAGWEVPKFIATLAGGSTNSEAIAGDEHDWAGFEYNEQPTDPPGRDWGPGFHTARVTPDGTGLAFQSERPLTGYDNGQAEPGDCEHENNVYGKETGRCREVYLYDATTAKLVCASCDPSGARPVGPAELGGHEEEETNVARLAPFYLPRNLSEGGGRLFFQSPDALVPTDTDAKLDVYEWEAAGEGSCVRSGGCVLPISDVAGDSQSHFMDASPNGEDVFIATAEQLVAAADTDTRVNVYDVRVGGGFPVTPAASGCDNGDSCLPPVSPQPSVFAPTGSATFNGLGNPAPAVAPPAVVKPKPTKKTVKCKRGKKLTHGKCVKQKRRKAKKATRPGNKRGAPR